LVCHPPGLQQRRNQIGVKTSTAWASPSALHFQEVWQKAKEMVGLLFIPQFGKEIRTSQQNEPHTTSFLPPNAARC